MSEKINKPITYNSICDKQKPENFLAEQHPVDSMHRILSMLDLIRETVTTERAGEEVVIYDSIQNALSYSIFLIEDVIKFEINRLGDVMDFLHEKTYKPD